MYVKEIEEQSNNTKLNNLYVRKPAPESFIKTSSGRFYVGRL